jgi:hypothetical protein
MTTYTNDIYGMLLQIADLSGAGDTYSHDKFGQILRLADTVGAAAGPSYSNDMLGQLKRINDGLSIAAGAYTNDIYGQILRLADGTYGAGGGGYSSGIYGQLSRIALLGGVGKVVTTTFDPAHTDASIALSNGNLTATGSVVSAFKNAFGTISKSAGKFYHEVSIGASNGTDLIGLANNSLSVAGPYPGSDLNSCGWVKDGRVLINVSPAATIATWATSNLLSQATDLDNKKIWFRLGSGGWNNDILANQNPATNTGGVSISTLNAGPYFPVVCPDAVGTAFTANFGATAYTQSAPSGFGNWA